MKHCVWEGPTGKGQIFVWRQMPTVPFAFVLYCIQHRQLNLTDCGAVLTVGIALNINEYKKYTRW